MNAPRIILIAGMAGLLSWCLTAQLDAQYVDLLWGRLAHYPLDNGGEDISGNERHGLIYGTLAVPDRKGAAGRAVRLDGDGDYISCGSNFQAIRSAVTISCWMKSERKDSYSHLVSKYDFEADAGFILGVKNEQVLWAGRNKSGQFIQLTSGTRIADGRWHHLAGVIEGSRWSVYVDGKLENSYESGISASDLSNEMPLTVGRYENADNGDHRYFQGSMDEVIIYDRPLSDCEIEILYEGNKYRER